MCGYAQCKEGMCDYAEYIVISVQLGESVQLYGSYKQGGGCSGASQRNRIRSDRLHFAIKTWGLFQLPLTSAKFCL